MPRLTSPWYAPTWTTDVQSRIHTNVIEMVQRRAARFVTSRYRNTSSVTYMLDYLGWESHETRRSKLQLIVLYKIVHGLIDIPSDDYLIQGNSRTRALRAAHSSSTSGTLHLQRSTRTAFSPSTIPLWNRLPATVAEAPSLVSFKRGLSHLTF